MATEQRKPPSSKGVGVLRTKATGDQRDWKGACRAPALGVSPPVGSACSEPRSTVGLVLWGVKVATLCHTVLNTYGSCAARPGDTSAAPEVGSVYACPAQTAPSRSPAPPHAGAHPGLARSRRACPHDHAAERARGVGLPQGTGRLRLAAAARPVTFRYKPHAIGEGRAARRIEETEAGLVATAKFVRQFIGRSPPRPRRKEC